MREEFADMLHRNLGVTGHRLRLLRHSHCACGNRATVLQNMRGEAHMFCSICAGWEDIKRRRRRMSGDGD